MGQVESTEKPPEERPNGAVLENLFKEHVDTADTNAKSTSLQVAANNTMPADSIESSPNIRMSLKRTHDRVNQALAPQSCSPPRLSSTFHRDDSGPTSPHTCEPLQHTRSRSPGIDRYVPSRTDNWKAYRDRRHGHDDQQAHDFWREHDDRREDDIYRDYDKKQWRDDSHDFRDRRYARNHGDRWEPRHRQSSPTRRLCPERRYWRTSPSPESSRRRSSPPRRQLSSQSPWLPSVAGFGKSPPRLQHRDSLNSDQTLYSNMKWVRPNEQTNAVSASSTSIAAAATATKAAISVNNPNASPSASSMSPTAVLHQPSATDLTAHMTDGFVSPKQTSRVAFNGLTDVPTGPSPKLGLPTGPASRSRQKMPPMRPVDESVHHSPHIYITAASLLPHPATIRHLRNVVRGFNPVDVLVDPAGYYIIFSDTSQGHTDLAFCVQHCNGFLLFNEYTLEAHAHHNYPNVAGSTLRMDRDPNYLTQYGADGDREPINGHVDHETRRSPDGEEGPTTLKESTSSQVVQADSSTTRTSINVDALRDEQLNMSVDEAATQISCQPVPLRVPSRQDRDDTASSISGKTTSSDMSASKLRRCHACKEASLHSQDPLVQCSTCPRRYHRRCHQESTPSQAIKEESWQCRRCVKKSVPLDRLMTVTSDKQPSPGVPASVDNQPPAKRRRVEEPEIHGPTEIMQRVRDMAAIVTRLEATRTKLAPASVDCGAGLSSHSRTSQQDHSSQDKTLHLLGGSNDDNTRTTHTAANLIDNVDTAMLDAQKIEPPVPEQEYGKGVSGGALSRSGTPKSTSEEEAIRLVELSFTAPPNGELSQTAPTLRRSAGAALQEQNVQAEKVDGGSRPDEAEHITVHVRHHEDVDALSEKESTGATQRLNNNKELALDEQAYSASMPEVPDSPVQALKDPRLQRPNSENQLHDNLATGGNMDSASPVDSVIQDVQGPRATGMPKLTAKRTRPSGPFLHCVKCKTKFFKSASSTSEICPKCKQQTSAQAAGLATPADSPPQAAPRLVPLKGLGKDNRLQGGPHTVGRAGAPAQSFETPKKTGLTVSADRSEAESVLRLSHLGAGAACQECRKRHIKCVHPATPHVHKSQSEVPKSRPETDSDPLDFWSTPHKDTMSSLAQESDMPSVEEHVSTAEPAPVPGNDGDRTPAEHQPQLGTAELAPTETSTTTHKVECGKEDLPQPVNPAFPVEQNDDPGSDKRRRKSQKGGHGLGDSLQRPPNTYERLIRMALCDAVDHRLQSRSVVRWIANNIPNYDVTLGVWPSGVTATLSMHHGEKGKKLWRMVEKTKGDRHTDGDGNWYELPRGVADTVERWDPVLKEPVSPLQKRKQTSELIRAEQPAKKSAHKDIPRLASADSDDKPQSPINAKAASLLKARTAKADRRKRKSMQEDDEIGEARNEASMEVDPPSDVSDVHRATPAEVPVEARSFLDDDTSDEEPIARRRRSMQFPAPPAMMQASTELERPIAEHDTVQTDAQHTDREHDIQGTAATKSATVQVKSRTQVLQPVSVSTRDVPSGKLLKLDAENLSFTAKSLFEEWPEYEPSNLLDKRAKAAEIKQRPTKKQMFGKAAMYSRLASKQRDAQSLATSNDHMQEDYRRAPLKRTLSTPRKSNRASFVFDIAVSDKKSFDNVEDFLGVPDESMPILYQQQLAFRDGTRDENGRLPRAKVIYKTGFA